MKNNNLGQYLDWDSEFFGIRIAKVIPGHLTRVNVKELLEWGERQHIDCFYFLCNADDKEFLSIAHDHHFSLVDIRITLESRLGSIQSDYKDTFQGVIRPAVVDDLAALMQIARVSHRNTRFYFDGHFPNERCDELYEIWIEKSYYGFADAVLVAEINGHIVGYVTCHRLDDLGGGQIGLIAVSSHYQRMGIGQTLVNTSLDWFGSQGLKNVSVVTQGRNISSLRMYQHCGFLITNIQLWYHYWPQS